MKLKKYEPINRLRSLLPHFSGISCGIDGIIFQHSGFYKYGADVSLLKWKPHELCSADFRLMNGRQVNSNNNNDNDKIDVNDDNNELVWHFDLGVS